MLETCALCFAWFKYIGLVSLDPSKNTRLMPWARDIPERPRIPSGVAAFMSIHSKTPYITP